MRAPQSTSGQRGLVLLVSLLVLLVLGVIATTVALTNQLQLHMAGTDEARIAALQQALAAVESVLASGAGMSLKGGPGYRVCSAASVDEACDEKTIVLEPDAEPAAGSMEVAVVRMAPLVDSLPVMGEAVASSTVHYRVARFEVQATYDGIPQGLGRAAVAQGVQVRLPAASLPDGGNP